jgi:chromosomal replication initiation ATPase DnaA
MRMAGVFSKSDERILGSSDFVEDVLSHAQETMEKGTALKAEGIGYDQVVAAVADLLSLQPHDLLGPGKERTTVKGRILVCYWAVKELGMSMTEVAKKIGIAVPTVSVAVKKGCKIVNDEGLLLADILNIKM